MAEQSVCRDMASLFNANAQGSSEQPATSRLRPNLPLPRELCDQICGYLLDHKHVHDKPFQNRPDADNYRHHFRSANNAHTFRFHVGILAVNNTINEEASEILKSNEFVVVSYKLPLLPKHFHLQSVPIVCEHPSAVARIRFHVLRLHVQGSKGALRASPANEHKGVNSFCVVADDLLLLCRAIQYVLYAMPFPVKLACGTSNLPWVARPYVLPSGGAEPSMFVRTHIKFEATDLSDKAALRLLQPFRGMIVGGQSVRIQGCNDALASELQSLTEIMSPKTVWLNAMAWCILEHVEEDLANLRPCFDADDTWSAMCLCSKQSLPSVRFLFELPDECYKSDAGLPLGLLSLAMIDFTIAKAMAAVKEGLAYGPFIQNTLDTLEPLSKFFIELPKTVKEGMLSTSLATKMGETPRARADLRAAWFISLFSLISTTDITRTSPRYLFNFDQLQPFLKGNRHFEHDHKLVRDLVTDPDMHFKWVKNAILHPDIVQLTSTGSMGLQLYHEPILEHFEKPAGLEGFVDTAYLAKLHAQYPGEYDQL